MTRLNTAGLYHYRTSGLDNVYLLNGFKHHDTGYGKGVSIQNLDGLHRAIAVHLVGLERGLLGKEFRFLRVELDMSQKILGEWLEKSDQAVTKWEKENKVPRQADIILRRLYMESIRENPLVSELIQQFNTLDRQHQTHEEFSFKAVRNQWREAA